MFCSLLSLLMYSRPVCGKQGKRGISPTVLARDSLPSSLRPHPRSSPLLFPSFSVSIVDLEQNVENTPNPNFLGRTTVLGRRSSLDIRRWGHKVTKKRVQMASFQLGGRESEENFTLRSCTGGKLSSTSCHFARKWICKFWSFGVFLYRKRKISSRNPTILRISRTWTNSCLASRAHLETKSLPCWL